jgi:hypothetical protein
MTADDGMTEHNADRVARRATAVGVGLLVLMPTWLIAVRVTALLWDPPVGPTVALLIAIATCAVVAAAMNRRLHRSIHR